MDTNTESNDSEKRITLTYLNIRQSIAILLARIILTDVLMATLIIFAYLTLISGSTFINYSSANTSIFLTTFIILGIIKVMINCHVIMQWLNEYYEITPKCIIHKKGIIFRKTEQYNINNIREVDVIDSFLGEIFNYATISIFDLRKAKYLDMYFVHNANRYAKVLKELHPDLEIKKEHINLPFLPNEEDEMEEI